MKIYLLGRKSEIKIFKTYKFLFENIYARLCGIKFYYGRFTPKKVWPRLCTGIV